MPQPCTYPSRPHFPGPFPNVGPLLTRLPRCRTRCCRSPVRRLYRHVGEACVPVVLRKCRFGGGCYSSGGVSCVPCIFLRVHTNRDNGGSRNDRSGGPRTRNTHISGGSVGYCWVQRWR